MSNIVPYHESLPAHFHNHPATDDQRFGAGFENRSFPRISTRDNRFSLINLEGEELLVNQVDNGASFLDICFVDAHPKVTKTFYEGAYDARQEGVQPTCFSNDGIRPDPSSQEMQNSVCNTCPHNAFGSASNGKGKACQDNKRTAVFLAAPTQVVFNRAAQVLPPFETLWGYKLPPMTAKNLETLRAKINALPGVRLPMVAIRATFVSQGVVGFNPVGYISAEGHQRSRAMCDGVEAKLICGTKEVSAPLALGPPPAHLDEVAKPLQVFPTASSAAAPASVSMTEFPQTIVAGPVSSPFPHQVPPVTEAPAEPKRKRGRPAKDDGSQEAPAGQPAPAAFPSDQSPGQPAVVASPQLADPDFNDMLKQAMGR